MLSETKLSLLEQLVTNASEKEIIWTNGYLAGLLAGNKVDPPPAPVETRISLKPTILYGTETGNAKKVATKLLTGFKKNKIRAKTADVFQYDYKKLEKESLLLVVISTQGEGELPQNAQAFYDKLLESQPNLEHLKYAVFGLGDSSYPLYCHAGILLDEALEKTGAQRILPLVKADTDYSALVDEWEEGLIASLLNTTSPPKKANTGTDTVKTLQKTHYTGRISHKVILNDRGSNKETYHLEISPDETVAYEPGDALGIVPRNEVAEVQQLISLLKEDPDKVVSLDGQQLSLTQALLERNIRGLGKRSLEHIGKLLGIEITAAKADLVDVLHLHPAPESVHIEDLLKLLLPIAPRLYSISSSTEAHEDEVHLTVTLNRFQVDDAEKTGLASKFLADFPLDTSFEFYIHKNPNFKLPAEDSKLIMIGPGTGIAPFRSFISHRDAIGAEGENWLFFGEQHFVSDFYYQTEIQEWIASGVLNRFDVAFSRDQEQKIYVQDRIREKAADFNRWLEEGASLYICGQKEPMCADVENSILEAIAGERNIGLEEARAILEDLETAGRYQKDVY